MCSVSNRTWLILKLTRLCFNSRRVWVFFLTHSYEIIMCGVIKWIWSQTFNIFSRWEIFKTILMMIIELLYRIGERKKKLRPQTKIVSAAKCWSVQFSEEMNCTKPKKRWRDLELLLPATTSSGSLICMQKSDLKFDLNYSINGHYSYFAERMLHQSITFIDFIDSKKEINQWLL